MENAKTMPEETIPPHATGAVHVVLSASDGPGGLRMKNKFS